MYLLANHRNDHIIRQKGSGPLVKTSKYALLVGCYLFNLIKWLFSSSSFSKISGQMVLKTSLSTVKSSVFARHVMVAVRVISSSKAFSCVQSNDCLFFHCYHMNSCSTYTKSPYYKQYLLVYSSHGHGSQKIGADLWAMIMTMVQPKTVIGKSRVQVQTRLPISSSTTKFYSTTFHIYTTQVS